MTPTTKKSFRISLYLHVSVFSLLLIFTFFRSCKKESKPYVFTMVVPPAQEASQSVATPAKKAPPPPPSRKAETSKAPKIAKKDPPKEKSIKKPTPKKEPVKEPELKRVSYAEFQKKHNKEDKRPTPKKIIAPKLNVDDITADLENIVLSETATPSKDPSQLSAYIGQIRQRVDSVWQAPQGVSGDHIQATVSFKVSQAGILSNVRLLSSSGNKEFDNSILSAFKSLTKLLPPPDRESYTFQLTFRINQA